jgi:hypothetical protein
VILTEISNRGGIIIIGGKFESMAAIDVERRVSESRKT